MRGTRGAGIPLFHLPPVAFFAEMIEKGHLRRGTARRAKNNIRFRLFAIDPDIFDLHGHLVGRQTGTAGEMFLNGLSNRGIGIGCFLSAAHEQTPQS